MVEKNELLQMIINFPHRYTVSDFAEIFEMKKTEDFVALNKMLNQLENDFLIIRDYKNHYTSASESGLLKGKISINRRGFGFLDIDENHSVFIPKTSLNGALDEDEVIVQVNGSMDDHPEGEVKKIISRSMKYVTGTFRLKRKLEFVLDDERIESRVRIDNLSDFKVVNGIKAYCKVLKYSDPMVLHLEKIIGHENDPGVDISAVLLSYGIEAEFPETAIDQCKTIEDHVTASDKIGRTDLTNQLIVTIDGDDAKDLDDAISVEKIEGGFRLGVHIADVSHYVTENSPIDIEARKRGTSTYVVDRVVPMLPHYLSNGICSLNEKVERLTMSCVMEIDEEGNITNYSIFPSIIKSSARMTYNNVNKILEGDLDLSRKYADLIDLFGNMHECAQILRKKRSAEGSIDFDREEAKIKVDSNGKVVEIGLRERGEAEKIIEDFMVTANICVARHTKWLETPSLYRVHETPMLKKMREFSKLALILGYKIKGSLEDVHPQTMQKCLDYFKDEECYPVVSTMMLRCMQKARYDSKPLGHFGLALEDYSHFTSPIRRYPDLIVHRMLKKYCSGNEIDPVKMDNDQILVEELGEETSLCERKAVDAEREVEDMKKAEYMHDKVGQIFDGIISSITKYGFYVELPNTVEGLVRLQDLSDDYYNYDPTTFSLRGERTGKVYGLGQSLKIKVASANKEKREINFVLYQSKSDKRKKPQRWI